MTTLIPLTVGFIGKFYLFFAGVEAALWVLLGALVIGSGIGLYYYLRIVYRMVLPAEDNGSSQLAAVNLSARGVLAILFLLLLILGVYPGPVVTLIEVISATI